MNVRRLVHPVAAAVMALAVLVPLTAGHAARAQVPAEPPCAPAPADPAPFTTNTNRTGLVDLFFFNAQGATVTYYECVGARAVKLGEQTTPNAGVTELRSAAPWRCGRLERHFAATAIVDGAPQRGLASVRTMSCAHRFRIEAPRTAALGRTTRVRLVDRWRLGGIRTRLCVTAPSGQRDCHTIPFAAAKATLTRTFRPAERGRWTLDLAVAGFHVHDTVAVGVRSVPVKPLPVVLATGDSTMQGVESSLADDLGAAADVVSDVHPGYSMSLNDGWPALAHRQVAASHPDVVLISLGAAEGFSMKTADGTSHACCDAAWVTEYTRRVARVMDIYRRGGTRVFYETIVAQRAPARQVVVNAVNAAILAAAKGRTRVTVLRADLLFSPHGYQEYLHDRGRDVDVREPDGVHLNASGTAIEAQEAAAAIRGKPSPAP
ncbi:hypothetical protein NBH00_12875 [Paraconexibacter antarcticus]|uniref:GDSL-like lipase/acylhydrolase family protein n=1 Tax=Paraconexibacter antarcticus TaxID=2949664 RepID=A0ABY5DN76_9ACTN|nr:hypothetical protein [Paraconexibacter antarcticus]UTI62262.1 hypothetical protein NBH00_12875 [Paraconexibacter antarcticus]